MGSCQSTYPGLTQDVLEELSTLTYLNKGEILYLMKKFNSINPEQLEANYHHRFPKRDLIRKFEVLRNNPFQDRLFKVFSSENDDCLSFEDLVDMCSAMSAECPTEVKAAWAFRLFDLDDDNQISHRDIKKILDRLTWDPNNRTNFLSNAEKDKISEIIVDEINLDKSGSIGLSEFKIIMSRLPEFKCSFYFRL